MSLYADNLEKLSDAELRAETDRKVRMFATVADTLPMRHPYFDVKNECARRGMEMYEHFLACRRAAHAERAEGARGRWDSWGA